MTTRCLICNSSVVLSKDAAQAIVRLIRALDGFLRGIQRSTRPPAFGLPCESPLERAFSLIIDGISGAASRWADTSDFIHNVRKHQFIEYDCLCLRGGAKYDEQPHI